MIILDLTHTIKSEMPVYPGTEGPVLSPASTYEKDGFKETLLSMYSHTGTHMDAPSHVFPERPSLDTLNISRFAGSAVVVDCTGLGQGDIITMDHIENIKQLVDSAEFVIFRTGWDRYWGKDEYFGDYPYIEKSVAEYLVSSGKKGVCLDTIGLDPISDTNLTLHKIILSSGMVIVENLTNLERIPNKLFTFYAMPLKFENSDGAPIRAVAVIDD